MATGLAAGSASAIACGVEAYIGQVCFMAFNYCPRGTIPANGQLVPIMRYAALYSLLGTRFGGDGQSTFALPDLRGRAAVGLGVLASSGRNYQIGEQIGAETQDVQFRLPLHAHYTGPAVSVVPADGKVPGASPGVPVVSTSKPTNQANTSTVATGTEPQPVQRIPVRDPALVLNACMAVEGIYPGRD